LPDSHYNPTYYYCYADPSKYAWGDDEADVTGKNPMSWFGLGLTIVDSIDTLLLAGLEAEYLEVRCFVVPVLSMTVLICP
jgi:mannosyl-oligosaccharide alpha-1,2-mannosidase